MAEELQIVTIGKGKLYCIQNTSQLTVHCSCEESYVAQEYAYFDTSEAQSSEEACL